MKGQFLEIRCPNRPREGQHDHQECRRMFAGPSIDTLLAYDFKIPWVDTRQCPWCKVFFEVTIIDMDTPPIYRMIPKEERIDFVLAEKFFGLSYVLGRKITRRGKQ